MIESLQLPDQNDRHVLAAAIKCGAHHIVTNNLKDFPEGTLQEFDLEAVSADRFLMQTFELYPIEATAVINTVRLGYQKPPFSPAEFVKGLSAKNMPLLSAKTREYFVTPGAPSPTASAH